MDNKAKGIILNELDERIEMENVAESEEAIRALEEFEEWFIEMFVI